MTFRLSEVPTALSTQEKSTLVRSDAGIAFSISTCQVDGESGLACPELVERGGIWRLIG
jgi:hypothetical protein